MPIRISIPRTASTLATLDIFDDFLIHRLSLKSLESALQALALVYMFLDNATTSVRCRIGPFGAISFGPRARLE